MYISYSNRNSINKVYGKLFVVIRSIADGRLKGFVFYINKREGGANDP